MCDRLASIRVSNVWNSFFQAPPNALNPLFWWRGGGLFPRQFAEIFLKKLDYWQRFTFKPFETSANNFFEVVLASN